MLGCLSIALSSSTKTNGSLIVCAVLALDMQNYCYGDHNPAALDLDVLCGV